MPKGLNSFECIRVKRKPQNHALYEKIFLFSKQNLPCFKKRFGPWFAQSKVISVFEFCGWQPSVAATHLAAFNLPQINGKRRGLWVMQRSELLFSMKSWHRAVKRCMCQSVRTMSSDREGTTPDWSAHGALLQWNLCERSILLLLCSQCCPAMVTILQGAVDKVAVSFMHKWDWR